MEVGELDPEAVHLPNVFVDRIILGRNYEKRIEVQDSFGVERVDACKFVSVEMELNQLVCQCQYGSELIYS